MPPVFVITSRWSDSDKRSIEGVFGDNYVRLKPPAPNAAQDISQWVLHTFEHIADEIEAKVEQHGGVCALRNATAIVELTDGNLFGLEDLSPISVTHDGWTIVTAMLVLAFPEMHWVFKNVGASRPSLLFADAHHFGTAASLGKIRE